MHHGRGDVWEAGARLKDLDLGGARLSLDLGAFDFDGDAHAQGSPRGFGPFQEAPWLLDFHQVELGKRFGADLAGSWAEGQDWNLGVEYQDNHADLGVKSNYHLASGRYLEAMLTQPDILPDAERHSRAAYAQWQARWSADWASTLGLRRDSYDDVGDATSPRAALIYSGFPDQVWKLIHARAFRAPSLSELHLTANPLLLGNTALEPITLESTELAWQWSADRLSLELSAYRQTERERVGLVPLGGNRVQRANVGRLRSLGLEWALRWRFAEAWELGWNGSQIMDRDEALGQAVGTDFAEDILPKTLSGLSLDGRRGQWSWHLGGQYVGRVPLLERTPYWLWRGRLAYAPDGHQEWSLTGSNLLDEAYDDLSDPAGLGRDAQGRLVRAAPQRGRQLMLAWLYRW